MPPPKALLTLDGIKSAAREFLTEISLKPIRHLKGVTDGKAVGTHVEHAFHVFLSERYSYSPGSAASGIDMPELGVDLKVTSIRQPQSSCPFRDATQKVYGLGYHLLVFVYEKVDTKAGAVLTFHHAVFVDKERTADFQTTKGISEILERDGNIDDVRAFLEDRMLPLDEIGRSALAEQIVKNPPLQGYLTISNALQWRLQYSRVISMSEAKITSGVEKLLA